jgi:hypothetical protein
MAKAKRAAEGMDDPLPTGSMRGRLLVDWEAEMLPVEEEGVDVECAAEVDIEANRDKLSVSPVVVHNAHPPTHPPTHPHTHARALIHIHNVM